ncbi:hypothetical protein [Vibrio phage JSF13]|jgi:hypothetical protein|uniref:Uncharacterized protein ORF135 n=1 Tax=Vibrio phage ICP1 TaxID=979525 RepID=F1D1F8_9CAUD|nr:hypothetical protein ViPhICP1_gp136 [Vibrio phage ICP1]ADX88181.1 hypothetical protein TUST1-191_00675 [Vibrio phage ICP1_2006_D]ADX88408.1 hypothetical protein TUST1-182_00675 [Vibrio phage ICP1_2006_C]ADX88633.1 hypothetical protein TUST1-159_00665 [Vibrio phage ICP1_2006_B]ADX88859.1 hypothetical protein TUST1-17_00665 [Vibrio phage ICP1_2006_A]ADX89090.1 hypothetical protein TUST1-15_00690 [Vibrio phage ICP1_2005_A]ADX89315.1 hypothetical protein TUST1-2_00675 [Vibrio phage ICP1_2001_A
MANIKVRAKNSQRKRGRGRPAAAVVGDLESVIDRIQASKNISDVEIANNLEQFEKILMEVALGNMKSVNKEQIRLIERFIDRAEALLDDYYESVVGEGASEEIAKKKDTVSSVSSLISLVPKEA